MRILFAGGGTGGHIYPALAIAKAVKELEPKAQIEFVGTPSGLETSLVPRAGYTLHLLPVGKLHHSAAKAERLKTVFKLPWALIKAFLLILRFRPDVVVGVGGYASGPAVLAAALMGRRTLIWEPNAFPGMANRWLSRFVDRTLVVFSNASRYMSAKKSVQQVAMPVRDEIEKAPAAKLADSTSTFHILVFGGSQGARAINNAVLEAVKQGGDWLTNTKIVHQTGALDFTRLKLAYGESSLARDHVEVLEYLHDMPARYAQAQLVVSRAGTGTLSELAACGKAAILIPLPTAADDHQTQNAQALVSKGGAILLPQSELSPERLKSEITALKTDVERRRLLEKNIRQFHQPRAVYEIAKLVLDGVRS